MSWILYNGVFYNLSVLLRIEPIPDGGFILQHQNETVNIPNTAVNESAIRQIANFIDMNTQ